jgi:hypothetical protein
MLHNRFALAAAAASIAWVAPAALGDEFVDKANDGYKDIRSSLRSDVVLLPALAKLTDPPSAASSLERAELLLTGMSGFDTAAAWAAEPSQQAAITALKKATTGRDYREGFGFGQPYGADSVPADTVRSGMYTELGDPPTLAGAQILFMPALDKLAILVNVEASRLSGEDKPAEAAELLVSWCIFCRQFSERQFYREASWGLTHLSNAFERLRDIVYLDSQGAKKIPVAWLTDTIKRIDDPKGLLGLDRMKFPHADYYAAQQIIARCFPPKGKPDEAQFAATMARMGSTEHPLRLFSEAARWRTAATKHADEVDTSQQLEQTFGDFRVRWELLDKAAGYFDRRMGNPTAYSSLNRTSYAVIAYTLPDMLPMVDQRQIIRTEAGGTSHALAVVAYYYASKTFPVTKAAVRPSYIEKIPADPFNPPDERRQLYPNFEYFVPIRDTKDRFGPREDPKPHRANIVVPGGQAFDVPLGDDQFVLYSVGSDNAKNWADRVQNVARGAEGRPVQGADYLIWPPVLSLYRRHLQDIGQLK